MESVSTHLKPFTLIAAQGFDRLSPNGCFLFNDANSITFILQDGPNGLHKDNGHAGDEPAWPLWRCAALQHALIRCPVSVIPRGLGRVGKVAEHAVHPQVEEQLVLGLRVALEV